MGRFHPQLVRFAQSLASTGAAVLVPEVPEWQRLEVSPRVIAPTIRGSIDELQRRPEARPGPVGVIGFSFGAPGVAISASQEELADDVAGIVLFGGYCSLLRTLTCFMTGQHEWEGVRYELSPDPYGRWVVASNHLTDIPGLEDAGDVAKALRDLAADASGKRVSAWDPYHDTLIAELRASLPERRHELFDCFAPLSSAPANDPAAGRVLAEQMFEACTRVEPLLEPAANLSSVTVPTQLIHGRGDRLIPFTEGLRLMDRFPEHINRGITVTSLFNHSADHVPDSLPDQLVEKAAMFQAIRGLVNTV